MGETMVEKKKSDVEIFVHNRTIVSFMCPHCKLEKEINIGKVKNASHWNIKAKCTRCKNDFTVSFNFRKFFRKRTNLHGTLYKSTDLNDFLGDAVVVDISLAGVGFRTDVDMQDVSILALRFILDNNKNTEIVQKIKIESIRGDVIGASFVDGVVLDKNIRSYINDN